MSADIFFGDDNWNVRGWALTEFLLRVKGRLIDRPDIIEVLDLADEVNCLAIDDVKALADQILLVKAIIAAANDQLDVWRKGPNDPADIELYAKLVSLATKYLDKLKGNTEMPSR